MDRQLALVGTLLAICTAIAGATVTIETRYAKSVEVKEQLEDYYAKQIKLRILEIDLKTNPTPADHALRQYLIQELQKNK